MADRPHETGSPMHMHLKVLKFPRFVLSLAKDKDKILRNFIPQLKLDMDISYFM